MDSLFQRVKAAHGEKTRRVVAMADVVSAADKEAL